MLQRSWKKAAPSVLTALYWMFSLLYWEGLLHKAVFESFGKEVVYAVGFSVSVAILLTLLVSFLNKGRFAVNLCLTLVLAVLYGSEVVYNFIFGSMYSVAMVAQGGEAMTSFWRELLSTMGDRIVWLLALFVPLAVLLLMRKFCAGMTAPVGFPSRGVLLVLLLLVFGATRYAIRLGGTELFSNEYFYNSSEIATNQTAQRFGLLTTFRLELTRSRNKPEEVSYYIPEVTEPETEPVQEAAGAESGKPKEYGANVLEIDWDALNAETEDQKLLAINSYCAQLSGTKKNEYTGMLKDYNLIVMCAESFDTGAIHPEVTPNLYRLSREGFLFENYYNSFPNTTTDGEYALLQGLYPDASRDKAVSSLYASRGSYLPFALGNAFRDQRGIECWGYHNYRGSYYGRDESHPNMGYTMQFAGDGMTFTTTWPASDLEMMEQSVDDYIGQEQFHAYYMTFSGHYKYDTSTNLMAKRNFDQVKDLPYDFTTKAYLSCHIELDKALGYLMERLEEAGIADRTAIVIAGDHFPYGLNNQQYASLVGYELDVFSKYKSSLIFWVGGLEEPVVVEEYCCNVDVLPTILNLWGLDYDSRMLAGTDVFSDGIHMAVLSDKSWLTDKVWFHTGSGKTKYLVEESELPEGYMDGINRMIATRFSISADILNNAYYNYVFGKDPVTVNRLGWYGK